jgi:hypothetical protein
MELFASPLSFFLSKEDPDGPTSGELFKRLALSLTSPWSCIASDLMQQNVEPPAEQKKRDLDFPLAKHSAAKSHFWMGQPTRINQTGDRSESKKW